VKPLDKDRKTGIVLIVLVIACLATAYNIDSETGKASFIFMGVAFFIWVMTLMAKSLDQPEDKNDADQD